MITSRRLRRNAEARLTVYNHGDADKPVAAATVAAARLARRAGGAGYGGPGIRDGAVSAPHAAGVSPATGLDRSNAIIQSNSPSRVVP
jgi:hypothetical protein